MNLEVIIPGKEIKDTRPDHEHSRMRLPYLDRLFYRSMDLLQRIGFEEFEKRPEYQIIINSSYLRIKLMDYYYNQWLFRYEKN